MSVGVLSVIPGKLFGKIPKTRSRSVIPVFRMPEGPGPPRRSLHEYLCYFREDVSMARDVSVYSYEIDEAIKSVQTTNRTIIPRYVIEEEIRENRHKYPRAGELPEIPLRMVISELVNRRPDTKIYGERPVS